MRRVGLWLVLGAAACGKSESSATVARDAERDAGKAVDAKAEGVRSDLAAKAGAAEIAGDAKVDDEAPTTNAGDAEISSARAVVLADGKLHRLAPSGKTELLAEVPGVTSCDVDDDHGVVWLVSQGEMSAFDPSDGRVHPVAKGIAVHGGTGSVADWQVQRENPPSPFPLTTAANVDGIDVCVALVVVVGNKPRVGGDVIAEGDREWYCFEEQDDDADLDARKLLPDEVRLKKGYDETKLVGAEFLVALDARRAKDGPRTRPELEPPPAPAPKVDKKQCEEDDAQCGSVEYIGGGRLWRVVTSNSRGDFYHEGHHIFDSKTDSWWDPATGKHSPTPDGESSIQASPDGAWGIYSDKIFSLAALAQTGTLTAELCGWE